MNELRTYAEYLRKRANRAEEFADLADKYSDTDTKNLVISWFNHSELSAKDVQKMLDSEQ